MAKTWFSKAVGECMRERSRGKKLTQRQAQENMQKCSQQVSRTKMGKWKDGDPNRFSSFTASQRRHIAQYRK